MFYLISLFLFHFKLKLETLFFNLIKKSSELDIWKLENGKIVKTVQLEESETILDCIDLEYDQNYLIVSNKKKSMNQYTFFIRGYKIQVRIKFLDHLIFFCGSIEKIQISSRSKVDPK